MDAKFAQDLLALGIVSYRDQETLYDIAKRCAQTAGVSMGGAGFVWGSRTLTIQGAVAGALTGMLAGTFVCTAANYAVRKQLQDLVQELKATQE